MNMNMWIKAARCISPVVYTMFDGYVLIPKIKWEVEFPVWGPPYKRDLLWSSVLGEHILKL